MPELPAVEVEPGEIVVLWRGPVVTEAPVRARIHLSALVAADGRHMFVSPSSGHITLAGQVTYLPVALEPGGVLLVERVGDWAPPAEEG